MKITLVVPPSGFQLDERVYPMLGVLKLAPVLKSAGHTVDVLDLSSRSRHWSTKEKMGVIQHVYKHGPSDAYGFSATMPQMPASFEALKDIRRMAPNAKTILGGAHPTMVNAAARQGVQRSINMLGDLVHEFDVVVAGDGEKAVLEALRPNVRGLIDADRPEDILFLTKKEVAESAWPDRELIDLHSYHCWVDGEPATSMIAQLGCPFKCGFCGGRNSPTFRRVRLRSSDDVVAEMEHIVDTYRLKGFMFLDDELNVSKSFPELLRAMKDAQDRRGERWSLCGLLKSELFTQEQADLMYEAGFRKILVGFESGDERILLNMQKIATVADNTRAVQLAHNAGLKIKALMSLGHPGETRQSIHNTRDWLLDVKADEFDATVLTIYPGTPYHDEAAESMPGIFTYTMPKTGDRLHFKNIDQFTDTPYYKGVPGKYESFVWTDQLSSKELVRQRDLLEIQVREQLAIPWPKTAAENQFEHSMGMK